MPASCRSETQSSPALWGDLGASWPADPAGLTFCTSEGTLDRKSSTSLLSMLYGFRNFLVNLLIPKTDIHTNISLALVPGGCAPLFPHKQIPAQEMHAVQERHLAAQHTVLLSLFRPHGLTSFPTVCMKMQRRRLFAQLVLSLMALGSVRLTP